LRGRRLVSDQHLGQILSARLHQLSVNYRFNLRPAAAHEPALAFTNLEVSLDGAGLSAPISNNVTLSLNGKFVTVLTNSPGISKLTLSVVPPPA